MDPSLKTGPATQSLTDFGQVSLLCQSRFSSSRNKNASTALLINLFTLLNKYEVLIIFALPCGSVVKNLPASAGDASSIPGLGRAPGEGNGNPPEYSCFGNYMDRGAWQATVQRGHKSIGLVLVTKQWQLPIFSSLSCVY